MHQVAGIANKLIVAIPFVLVTTLGLHTQSALEPYKFLSDSPIRNREISNYIPIVTETERVLNSRFDPDESKCLRVANDWIAGSRSGALKPLRPIAIDDTARDGVKGQIVRDCTLCAESLNYIALRYLRTADYPSAAKFAVKSAELMQTVRYFDFSTLSSSSLEERKSLVTIEAAAGHLGDQQKSIVRQALAALKTTPLIVKEMSENSKVFALQRTDDRKTLDSFILPANDLEAHRLMSNNERPSYIVLEDEELEDLINEFKLGVGSAFATNEIINHLETTI